MLGLSLSTTQHILKLLRSVGVEVTSRGPFLGRGLRRVDTFGREPWRDVREVLGRDPRCVVDVGAHVGQTALELRRRFADAQIYSFEPDPDNFRALTANTSADASTHRIQAAAGAAAGSARLHRNTGSQTHSLLPVAAGAAAYVAGESVLDRIGDVAVEVVALDDFCDARQVAHLVDLLKADAQGYEIEVLKGADRLLQRTPPPLLFLEVSFVPQYQDQPLFADVMAYLATRGFRLVALYDIGYPTHYCAVGANALFVHQSMAQRRA